MGYTHVVTGRSGSYVVRADPWNRGRSGTVYQLQWLQRLVRRDHSWRLTVRHLVDDPFGPVLHEEALPGRRDVSDAIHRIEAQVKAGADFK